MAQTNSMNMQHLFPSEDGAPEKRQYVMRLIEQIVKGVDELKNPDGVNLKGNKDRSGTFYEDLMIDNSIPNAGTPLEEVNEQLLELLHSHPYHSKYFLTNILPMASIPGILGMLTAFMVNGNNLWDVYGPAGAEAEVKVVSMMSKLIGYDATRSGGYTTWGGQGAVFSGLRLAISKFAPDALKNGIPGNFYTFCSEAAHYSLLKSVEATGLGRNKLIRVKTNLDSSMDLVDLHKKMNEVILQGGIPIYVVATMGTTDALGIDDIKEIYKTAQDLAELYGLRRAHIHADSALGGFFAFFNDYDFSSNPLGFSPVVKEALLPIHRKMVNLSIADTLCFDFQKLGQTPYSTSLYLVKDAADLQLLELHPDETPYVGHRGYGEYHTGYTLECSRMASSISIYSALLAFGIEGYQRLLAQYVEVNHSFRDALIREIPGLEIVNPDNPGIITLFRIYPQNSLGYQGEMSGACTLEEIEEYNRLNEVLFEILGQTRDRIFFGDTKKHLVVQTKDGFQVPLYATKIFVISPYTEVIHVEEIVNYLKDKVSLAYDSLKQHTFSRG